MENKFRVGEYYVQTYNLNCIKKSGRIYKLTAKDIDEEGNYWYSYGKGQHLPDNYKEVAVENWFHETSIFAQGLRLATEMEVAIYDE